MHSLQFQPCRCLWPLCCSFDIEKRVKCQKFAQRPILVGFAPSQTCLTCALSSIATTNGRLQFSYRSSSTSQLRCASHASAELGAVHTLSHTDSWDLAVICLVSAMCATTITSDHDQMSANSRRYLVFTTFIRPL
jgi:hypothetical protein